MIQIPETLPIPKHHTMSVVDSSKIQAFQDCPRGFFFRYVLGLQPEGPNIHLDFGSAWHEAMEQLLLGGYSMENVEVAYEKFLEVYREAFPNPITDDDNAPKNPEYAYKALKQYIKQYESDNFDVLYTETAGLVPIDLGRERHLAVKLDSIVRDRNSGEILSMEHKTTGRNSRSWRDKWSMMLQVESYTHLLYSLYPAEKVGKVMINGSVFTKSRTWDGVRIPVYKSKKQMAAFLWNVNHWIDQIEWHYQQLAKTTIQMPVMKAFPINCSSCSKYGCRMGGICSVFPNPVERFTYQEDGETKVDPPAGYGIDFWDPLRRNVDKADNVIETDSKGNPKIRKKTEEEKKKSLESRKEEQRKHHEEDDDFSYLMKPGEDK